MDANKLEAPALHITEVGLVKQGTQNWVVHRHCRVNLTLDSYEGRRLPAEIATHI